jgi:CRISPR-associated endonuclease Csn1
MSKILGLDLGISSVGWAVISNEYDILATGVRLFEEANADDNAKRRNYRGNRRLKRRNKQRIQDLRKTLIKAKIITEDFKELSNPYEIRAKGVYSKLTNDELATALLHIVKRRGTSLLVAEEETVKNELSPKIILKKHESELKKLKYVSQVQLKKLEEDGYIRGSENVFKTDDYVKETKAILSNQDLDQQQVKNIIEIISRKRHYSEGPGNWFSSSPYGRFRTVDGQEYDDAYKHIMKEYKNEYKFSSFSFSLNGNDYNVLKSGEIINKKPLNLINLMRGKCSIYKEELRAPKLSFSAELHNFLNDINNLSIISKDNQKISTSEKLEIIDIILNKGDFSPKGTKGLAKVLGVEIEEITGFRVNESQKPLLTEFKGLNLIRKAVYNDQKIIRDTDLMNRIADVLTYTQVIDERAEEFSKMDMNKEYIDNLVNLTGFNQYHSFSLKALDELNKEMLETNLNQMQIITNNGLNMIENETKLEFNDKLILSPVAKRVHKEAIKVVKALEKEFGVFDRIVIETTRAKNSRDEIKMIKDMQKRNIEQKNKVQDLIEVAGYEDFNINYQLALKLRLYNEQNAKCIYTNLPIDINKLLNDPKAYEVDHIIPYSISLDDSFSNKVLCVPLANQLKGNMTPFGYFASGKALDKFPISTFDDFKQSILLNKNYNRSNKRDYLLIEKTISRFEDMEMFINRNLNDTSYAIRSLMTTLKNYYKANGIQTNVSTIKGKQTSLFRGIAIHEWNKRNKDISHNPMRKDRNHYIHHAIDALIIAGLSEQRLFKYLYGVDTNNNEIAHYKSTGEIFDLDPLKDPELYKYLTKISKITENDIRFSWKKDSKPNRSFSDETIYSTRNIDGEDIVVKKYKDIYLLTNDQLKKVFEDEEKVKLLAQVNDEKTYDLLKKIYETYSHEKYPFAAYKEKNGYIKKYSRNEKAPNIKSLKYLENRLGNHMDLTPNYITTNKKVVQLQISAYRIDVYKNGNGEFKFVTIRYVDLVSREGKLVIDELKYNLSLENKGIDSTFSFMFSLYRNDIIRLQKKLKNGDIESSLYRFIATNNDDTNRIEIKSIHKHDDKQNTPTIGKSIIGFDKYNVSPTGLMNKVSQEVLKFDTSV